MLDMSNLTSIAKESLHNESKTDTLTERQSLLTCVSSYSPVRLNSIEELRTLLLEAHPARVFQWPESNSESMTKGICGPQQSTLFELLDLPAFCLKTYLECSDSNTQRQCLHSLPTWGMVSNTALYPLPMWEPDTDGNDCGSLESWATPNTMDSLPAKSPEALEREATIARPGRSNPANLRDQVSNGKNWPSPTCSDVTLPQAVAMWPTPDANMGARGTQAEWKPVRDSGHTASYTINQAVRDMYPTPTAHLAKETGAASEYDRNEPTLSSRMFESPEQRNGLALNPDWVEWLMGWPVGWSDIKPLTELTWRDWQTDPADTGEVPRVTDVKENRANRLKAIGNGQVAVCVVKAWELLA